MIPRQYAHNPQVQEPNRAYAGYYLPQMYSENYRVREVAELDALPVGSIVIGVTAKGVATPYPRTELGWHIDDMLSWDSEAFWEIAEDAPIEWLFVVYRPDLVKRRDGA